MATNDHNAASSSLPTDVGPIPERAQQEQWAYLRQVIDINPNLVFAKDREGRFTLVNKAVADVYGTTVDELIGKTDADFNSNAEEVAFFRAMDLEVMNSLKEKIITEEVITDAKGKVHFLQTVKRPIIGPDGQANQVLGVATDITERKQLEEQLRYAQKMEALGLLAGGIAHDFNNLLAVVLGNAELMLQRLRKGGAQDDRLKTSLELIVTASKRAESLTRQLLAFSRRQAIHPEILDLNSVLSEMENLLRRVIGEHIHLVVETRPNLLCVRADPGHIEQILMNLVVNARDAMPMGGTLMLTTSAVDLDAGYVNRHPEAKEGPHVSLVVSDTGVGMAPETMRRMFEPFFTTKPAGHGTGLGLSTVYGIVKQAGGHIVVTSALKKGSTFSVFLPADAESAPRKPAGSTIELSLRGHETVLVCEDEDPVLRLTSEILEDAGYQVIAARDGKQALAMAALHRAPIDLLLTDVVMPEMNGKELAEEIRIRRPETKILFMTGYSSDVLPLGVESDSTHQMVAKPFSPRHLLIRIRDSLDS